MILDAIDVAAEHSENAWTFAAMGATPSGSLPALSARWYSVGPNDDTYVPAEKRDAPVRNVHRR